MLPDMQTEVTWIIDALARNRKKTKSGLAAALGIDPSAVTRLLRGERRLKFSEAQQAATYLEVEPFGGFVETSAGYEEKKTSHEESSVPLFRVDAGQDGFWRIDIDRESVIERKPRSPQLSGVRSAFGFYTPDRSMSPRFKIGEIVWINPMRPVAPGDDAMLMQLDRSQDGDKVFLCELLEIHDDEFTVRQYGDGKKRNFPRSDWVALHVFARA